MIKSDSKLSPTADNVHAKNTYKQVEAVPVTQAACIKIDSSSKAV
jgi:hypothetical protein